MSVAESSGFEEEHNLEDRISEGDEEMVEGSDAEEDEQHEAEQDGENEHVSQVPLVEPINTESFEEMHLSQEVVDALQTAWKEFVLLEGGREAAGEAIYSTFVNSAPAIQSLFKSSRAVMAIRFMAGFSQLISYLDDPAQLKIVVETMGFQHSDIEVTVPRAEVVTTAFLEMLEGELGAVMNPLAICGFHSLMNYCAGAFIYLRVNFSKRLRLLSSSWAMANKRPEYLEAEQQPDDNLETSGSASGDLELSPRSPREDKNRFSVANKGSKASSASKVSSKTSSSSHTRRILNTSVPTTFPEMFNFNCQVMGFGARHWMMELVESWDTMVTNMSNTSRFQEECDVLSLRLSKYDESSIRLPEFKSVMLASLRSLVKDWGSEHESTWSWMWGNVETMLNNNKGKPRVNMTALSRFMHSLDDANTNIIRDDVFTKFFALAPAGQDWFKQSLTRLHYIADKILVMVSDMYKDPKRMVEELSALGLRHVGYGVPTDLFGPFVTAYVQVVRGLTEDDEAEEAFRWSVSLISRILVRVINEGATVVMNAINTNSAKQLRKAIAIAPRSKRAMWMLNVQVGTQSISPLHWAITSGALDAAKVIIQDLLTIRADRERYYFAVDELFERHPDIVSLICNDAPGLVNPLLDGLVWRSRNVENNRRRVNYYIKHLLVNREGGLSDSLEAIVDMGDPVIACHPVVDFLSELIWSGPLYWTFISCKSWLCLTTAIFIIAQSVLAQGFGKNQQGTELGDRMRILTFACRVFVYAFCMGQLAIYHIRTTVAACRQGETKKILCLRLPRYLGAFQEFISLIQCICLVFMFILCPKLYCLDDFYGNYEGAGVLSDFCPGAANVRTTYGALSTMVMFLFFLRLTDFAVLNNTLSAYVIVASRMVKEVALFLLAMAFTIAAFACSLNALFEYNDEYFNGVGYSSETLLEIGIGIFSPSNYDKLSGTVQLFAVVMLFVITVQIFLVNLLIAQIVGEYQASYHDRLGFARMHRIRTIYSIMPYVRTRNWNEWIAGLRLDQPLEFNMGDVGFAGGMQITEASNLHPTMEDTILRFGGSPSTPWPEEVEEEQGMERVEKLLQRMDKKMTTMKQSKSNGSVVSGMQSSSASSRSRDDN